MDPSAGQVVVTERVCVKWRVAERVADALGDELVTVCRRDRVAFKAHFLDVPEQLSGDIKRFVSLTLAGASAYRRSG